MIPRAPGRRDYADLAPLVALLVRAAPERLIWATNWPHAALAVDQRPDDARVGRPDERMDAGGCSAEECSSTRRPRCSDFEA